jgi:hypothetical protein
MTVGNDRFRILGQQLRELANDGLVSIADSCSATSTGSNVPDPVIRR